MDEIAKIIAEKKLKANDAGYHTIRMLENGGKIRCFLSRSSSLPSNGCAALSASSAINRKVVNLPPVTVSNPSQPAHRWTAAMAISASQ